MTFALLFAILLLLLVISVMVPWPVKVQWLLAAGCLAVTGWAVFGPLLHK